jgi:Trk-type K+ transport system membrane component
MLDKNVGDALLRLDLTPQTETPSAQIERIIDTDRRRVQRWTRISIVLWVLAALGAIVIFIIGGLAFPVIAKLLAEKGEGTLDNPDTPFLVLAKLNAICMVLGTASFVTLVAAGLATVLLLVRSRSATLRQINANLLQISEQLKRSPPGSGATASGAPSGG